MNIDSVVKGEFIYCTIIWLNQMAMSVTYQLQCYSMHWTVQHRY